MGGEDKGCRHGMGKAAGMGMGSGMPQGVWDFTKSSPRDGLLNTQTQKLKTCPTAFSVQSKGSISSAMGATKGSPGELRACLRAQRLPGSQGQDTELNPQLWGPEYPQSDTAEGSRAGRAECYLWVTRPTPAPGAFLPGLANSARRMKLEAIKN